LTLLFKARLYLWPTRSKSETVLFLAALSQWFEKRWSAHKSVYTIDETQPEQVILEPRTLAQKTFAQWPQVRWVRSRRVCNYFDDCIADAVNASVEQWMEALHIEKGRKIATTLVTALHRRRSETPIASELRRSLAQRKALEKTLPFTKTSRR
jgi:hypothetical protein